MVKPKHQGKTYKRADHPNQKDERKQLILQAATDELNSISSDKDFTVDALARRARLAKGTVYLYFDNKSSILRALLGDALKKLLTEISDKIANIPEPVNAKLAANVICNSLGNSDQIRRWARLLKNLSQGQQSECAAQEFRQQFNPFMDRLDEVMVRRLGGLRPGEGRQIMIYSWALLLGFCEMAENRSTNKTLSKTFKKGIPSSDLRLYEGLSMIIEGFQTRSC